jgi:hypothetical protein
MLTIYLCFLAGGVVLPFISFAMGFISGDSDIDADADLNSGGHISSEHDISADTGAVFAGTDMMKGADSMLTIGLVPTSLLSLSALAIIFGAVGAFLTIAQKGKLLTLLLAAVFGYLASVIVQTLIKSLRKIQTNNSGVNENELLLYDGKIIDTVLPGQMGSVSFVTLKGERISYPAQCEDRSITLKTGRIVRAKEFKDGIFIVEPKNKYE